MFLAAAGGAAGGSSMIIMLILIFVIFYFFMIRPENKRKKKLEEMRSELTVGDEIVTIGGIIGKVVQATEDTITFETGEDRVRIQVKKWAISTNVKQEEAEAKAAKRAGKPVVEKKTEKKEDSDIWETKSEEEK